MLLVQQAPYAETTDEQRAVTFCKHVWVPSRPLTTIPLYLQHDGAQAKGSREEQGG